MNRLRKYALPTFFWIFVLYLFLPLIIMAIMGLRDSKFVYFPIHKWTTHWYREVLFDRDILESLFLSFEVALLSTAISIIVGLPLAFLAARTTGYLRTVFVAVIVLPAFLPVIVSSIEKSTKTLSVGAAA